MTGNAHAQGSPAQSELTRAPRRVLVADDDDDLRRTVRSLLELDGWTVLEAPSGTQALSLARKEPLSVIFLDCRMPGMSGQEVYRHLRAAGVSTPVLLVTGSPDVQEAAAELGVSDYLGKPFDIDALYAAINAASRPRGE